jgi:hypothetical protein
LFAPSLVDLDIVLKNKKKKQKLEKKSSTATSQNWTPRRRRTREVCDFLGTSSGHAHNTHQNM